MRMGRGPFQPHGAPFFAGTPNPPPPWGAVADLLGLGTAAPAFAAILPTAVEASKGMRMRGGWEADGRRVGGGQAAYGKRIGEGSEEEESWVEIDR